MQKCNACGGVYEPVLADGSLYFHACPPLSAAELAAAVTGGKLTLPVLETPDIAVTRRTYERATKRDENVRSTAPADAGSMKTAGAGITPLAKPPSPVVIVP